MEDIGLVIESLTPEQYKKFYNDLPLPLLAVNHNIKGYTELMSNDEYQKKLLNTLLKNELNISNVSDNKIEFYVDLSNGSVIKYLREHMNNNSITISTKGISSKIISVDISYSNERDIQVINQIIDNYYLVNKSKDNKESNDYIMNLYQQFSKEYIDYLKEINRNDIMCLEEKHLQETVLPFNENIDLEISDIFSNEVSIRNVYNADPIFHNIPFDKLTDEQKMTMCNKYFRKIVKDRIYELYYKLKELYGLDFNIIYSNQNEQALGNYGVTGNLIPLDERNVNEILVNMYSNINYCSLNGDKAILNEDLIGQIMITILHEHEHLLQRNNMIDSNLKNAIDNFESINPSGSDSYFENYKNDPAELDANLVSFNRLIEISKCFNINNPESVIINKVSNVTNKAEESMNLYGNNKFNNYEELQLYLSQKLQDSIINYNDLGKSR